MINSLDLNCLWLSVLVAANEILPDKGYLKFAENFFSLIEKNILIITFIIVIKKIVFIEDYAFLINALIDLSEKTMNFKYRNLAIYPRGNKKFYLTKRNIFQNPTNTNDIFFKPIDIGDNICQMEILSC